MEQTLLSLPKQTSPTQNSLAPFILQRKKVSGQKGKSFFINYKYAFECMSIVSVEAAGGKCLPCTVDIRSEEQVKEAVEKAVSHFGGIDVLVNNASAIQLTSTENTSMKHYDLMHSINSRGTFLW
jgi:NAD(P)-dependent dehydrogenase (short-subunit alcohol dehydrogenase family)